MTFKHYIYLRYFFIILYSRVLLQNKFGFRFFAISLSPIPLCCDSQKFFKDQTLKYFGII